MEIAKSMDIFLKKCNYRQCAITTLKNYEVQLKPFVEYLEKQDIKEIEDVTERHISEYLESIPRSYSNSTLRNRYTYLKLFFTTLYNARVIDYNVGKFVRIPSRKRRIIPSFSKNEITDIMNSYDKTTFHGYRNYTIMSVLFGTGIRKGELLRLRIQDINFDCGTMYVMGKGNKERIVPIGNTLSRILQKYLKFRQEHIQEMNCTNSYALFIAHLGNPISESCVNDMFRDLKGLKKSWSTRVSAHSFRHTFAKLFLLNGGDLFSLQKILGHESIEVTRIYVDYNDNELKMQNDKFNPLDNRKWLYY